ncbi:MAG: GNAT family N-acetyltransferase [Thermoleophilia bacterium]|nr:GNAT family N-acetyltransferase [Thermoleophilia bacterium]
MRQGAALLRLPEPPLADAGLVLLPVAAEHVGAVTAACQDPEIPRWTLVPSPYTESDARSWVERAASALADGSGLHFVVSDSYDRRLLGAIGVDVWVWPICRIGYWVAREARGAGIATRALVLLSRWVLREHPIPRLELVTAPGNLASQRVAEKAGFTREGTLRASLEHHGEWTDCVMYSLLPGEIGLR